MLPEMHRVMKICPPKLVGRVRKREITGDELDQGYRQLHDAIHGVRQAMYALLHLAGQKDPRLPSAEKSKSKAESPAAPEEAPRAEESGITAPGGALPAAMRLGRT
jgi:hypothetical protein